MTVRPLLLLFVLAGGVRADEAVTLSGKRTAGRVVRVDATAVGLDVGGRTAVLNLRELAEVQVAPGPSPPADAKFDEVELTDGSVFRVGKLLVRGKVVVGEPLAVAGVPSPVVELPLPAVASVLRNAHDPKARADWQKVLAGRGKRDLIVVRQAAGGLNLIPGTVVEGTPAGDRLVFEKEDGTRPPPLPLSRATGGLVLNPPPQADVPPTLCRVLDAFGNTWAATGIEFGGDGLTIRTAAGATVRYPSRAGVRSLDFRRGNVLDLSDLALDVGYPPAEPSGPLGDQFPFAPKLATLTDVPLVGRTVAKGLLVPADVSFTAPVGEGYRTFRATVGLPETASAGGTFRLTVDVDGRPLFDAPVEAGKPARDLSLPVADGKRLRVVVLSDRPWVGPGVVLGDARLEK